MRAPDVLAILCGEVAEALSRHPRMNDEHTATVQVSGGAPGGKGRRGNCLRRLGPACAGCAELRARAERGTRCGRSREVCCGLLGAALCAAGVPDAAAQPAGHPGRRGEPPPSLPMSMRGGLLSRKQPTVTDKRGPGLAAPAAATAKHAASAPRHEPAAARWPTTRRGTRGRPADQQAAAAAARWRRRRRAWVRCTRASWPLCLRPTPWSCSRRWCSWPG